MKRLIILMALVATLLTGCGGETKTVQTMIPNSQFMGLAGERCNIYRIYDEENNKIIYVLESNYNSSAVDMEVVDRN